MSYWSAPILSLENNTVVSTYPDTPIIKETYRQTYSFTSHFSGAINQVLNYRDSLAREINSLANGQLNAFSPTCVVVIGRAREFEKDSKK